MFTPLPPLNYQNIESLRDRRPEGYTPGQEDTPFQYFASRILCRLGPDRIQAEQNPVELGS